MLIVDAQVHTWAASRPERPWSGGGEPQRETPFTNDDLRQEMNAAGVHRAVLVPPGWEGSRNDLALAAVRRQLRDLEYHPERHLGPAAPRSHSAQYRQSDGEPGGPPLPVNGFG